MSDLAIPWERPGSVYQSDGPAETVTFETPLGIWFRVSPTQLRGVDTGRVRFRVECLTCGEIVHEATTGSTFNVKSHLSSRHNREGKVE